MERKTIKIRNSVKTEIIEIVDFIENTYHSPIAAKKFSDNLKAYINGIAAYAEACPLNMHEQLRRYGSTDMRQTSFKGKWIILFDIDDHYVIIQKIIHAKCIIN